MKKENKEWVLSEKSEYTAIGYFLLIMRESYKYDSIVIKSNHYNMHYLNIVEALLKLNGWRQIAEPKKESVKRSSCTKCGKSFSGEIEKCTYCKSQCKLYMIKNEVRVLQRHGALQANYETLITEEDVKTCLLYIESQRNTQTIKDKLIPKRW